MVRGCIVIARKFLAIINPLPYLRPYLGVRYLHPLYLKMRRYTATQQVVADINVSCVQQVGKAGWELAL